MEPEDVKHWAVEHKLATGVSVVGVILVLGLAGVVFNAAQGSLNSGFGGAPQYEKADAALDRDRGGGESLPPTEDEASGSYVEVQESDVEINSENIENDISSIQSLAEEQDGYVEESSKRNGKLYTSADLTVRVPSESFQPFINNLKQGFEVESYSVQNYRLSTDRERTELDILNQTLDEYDQIRKEINGMENDEKKLDLLMRITEKQLEVKEKMGHYQERLSDKQHRGDYATVEIELKEQRKVDIVPDNIGNRFKSEVKEMLDTVVDTVINTVTGGIEIFFKAIQYLIYIAIIAIPVSAAYKLGRKVYKKYS